MLTGDFLSQFPRLKGIVITETERYFSSSNDKLLDFRILQSPTYDPFIDRISSDDVRTYLPYVGIIKATKEGKISVLQNIP